MSSVIVIIIYETPHVEKSHQCTRNNMHVPSTFQEMEGFN